VSRAAATWWSPWRTATAVVVGMGFVVMEEDRVLAAPIGFVVVVFVCHGLGGCNLIWASMFGPVTVDWALERARITLHENYRIAHFI
jgi:hypothetical protein